MTGANYSGETVVLCWPIAKLVLTSWQYNRFGGIA